jgi:hypothetical protein
VVPVVVGGGVPGAGTVTAGVVMLPIPAVGAVTVGSGCDVVVVAAPVVPPVGLVPEA